MCECVYVLGVGGWVSGGMEVCVIAILSVRKYFYTMIF